MARRGHGHSICPRITMYFILVLFSSFNSIEANWCTFFGVMTFCFRCHGLYYIQFADTRCSIQLSRIISTHTPHIHSTRLTAVWMWMCYRSAGQRRLSVPLIGWEFFFLLYEEPCVFPKKKTKKKRWSLTTIGKSNDILRYPSSFDHTNAV